MQSAEEFTSAYICVSVEEAGDMDLTERIRTRDAEWQARVDRLKAALRLYADRDNWEWDEEYNTFRRWLEPDSYTPYAYDGFSIAHAALAESEAAHE